MSGDFRTTLYTVDNRGRRKWVYAHFAPGRRHRLRRLVAWALMAFFLGMPWITIGGEQGILLNIKARRFVFFGSEFWADDTLFLFLVFGILAFALFFFTALLGRVWCGWACPETVFLEFLFRPIERLIEGSPARRRRLDAQGWTLEKVLKKGAKQSLFAFAAWCLASSFLAYFIGREPLMRMMSDWPRNNPAPFALTLIFMGLALFQFGWFREQFCTVLCPYARFQAVLMDGESVVVGYDVKRGEPRGKLRSGEPRGDCVDCSLCVQVCPTGIDIRNGVQLECIACTQCADACDSVMSRLGRFPGLIRYDSEYRVLGEKDRIEFWRPRVLVYGVILAVFVGTLVFLLATRDSSEIQLLRGPGVSPFQRLADGRLSNHVLLRLANKAPKAARFSIAPAGSAAFELITPQNPVELRPREIKTVPLFLTFGDSLLKNGGPQAAIGVTDEQGRTVQKSIALLGPDD